MNSTVAVHDWLEDPVTALARLAVPLYALATVGLWFVARPYGDTHWKRASASALVAAGIALVTNQLLSHLWERPRPFVAHASLTHVLSARTTDPSFPSDHAAAAFAIAFAVLAFSGRAGALFLSAATMIALSRIALGLHYPSDVVAGLLVGLGAATLATRLGTPWIARVVNAVSRVSDPLLRPVWDRLRRRTTVSHT